MPRTPRDPLELLWGTFCSAGGPSSPGGLSLNWYEAADLKELVGSEPMPSLPLSSLSEWGAGGGELGAGLGQWVGLGSDRRG